MKEWKHEHHAPWRKHRRWFFWRFALAFWFLVWLFVGIMHMVARAITNYTGGGREMTFLVLMGGCGLAIALPLLMGVVSWALSRRVIDPLAQVMAVTDAVAEGDLSVRVETHARGRFGRLSQSVNNMVGELERTGEQRRKMTADIAHELRTPLHIIQGNLEGILDGVYDPTAEHIQNTLDETTLLARLVADLGTLSQAEAGQLSLRRETVDVAELLTDIETSFSGQAELAGVALSVSLPATPLTMTGDIDRLNQVLTNLVANGLRHTGAGGSIRLMAAEIDNGVRLTVADTGEGIAAADLPFIFGRFWRGDHARTHTNGTGGGLGLAIARQLVLAHGGDIQVASTVGVGTTFTIDLPH